MKPRTRKHSRATSIKPRRDILERLARELDRSKVPAGAINTAMTAVRIIIGSKAR
jgi:hypothetical protein